MHRLRFPFLGYTVIIHWSWLIAVTLITWSLSTGYYPGIWTDHPHTLYWASGLFSTFALFFSILLHECAHAGVATAHGIKINDIMLHIVGGWTMFPSELSSPRLEAIVAVAASMLTAAYYILANGTIYAEPGAAHFGRRSKTQLARRLIKRLEGLGVTVEVRPAA